MKRILLVFLALLLNLQIQGQPLVKVLPGVGTAQLKIGRTTMREVDSIENYNYLKKSFLGGGVSSTGTLGNGFTHKIATADLAPGIEVAYQLIEDPKEDEMVRRKKYQNTKISGVLLSKPVKVINEKNETLLGRTEQEIRTMYEHVSFDTYYDFSKNTLLIDERSGICFIIDRLSKKCAQVEVFHPQWFCFSKNFSEYLKSAASH